MAKAKASNARAVAGGDVRCKLCGRRLSKVLLGPKKLAKLEQRLSELNEKLETKGEVHKKAPKWSKRIAKIQRRLDAHAVAQQAMA